MQKKQAIIAKRVSTTEQKRSSLSLINQEEVCTKFCKDNDFEIIKVVEDVASGKIEPEDRAGLSSALKLAKKTGATIIISKLDRLSRSVETIARLMNSGVPFISVETPQATPFMLHVYSAIAEMERESISNRIKDALRVKKEQLAKEGKKLGNPNAKKVQKVATKANQLKFIEFRAKTAPLIFGIMDELRNGFVFRDGKKCKESWAQTARILNERNIKTMRGGSWQGSQVMQFMKAYKNDEKLNLKKIKRQAQYKKRK